MGDVLSQDEIDSLLSALNSGEINPDEIDDTPKVTVKDYDFARPSKFSKDHLRTLEIIFENYGRLLSTNLPAYLRKSVQIEVMNAEANTYSEFSNALSNPVLLGVVDFAPLSGSILIELASNLGFAIVDRMLGGGGNPLEKSREFTEIELIILERIMEVCTGLLVDPWQSVTELQPRLERIETNSQFAQFISPSEMTAIVTMNMKIGTVEGLMNICIPYSCVESVIDKLNIKNKTYKVGILNYVLNTTEKHFKYDFICILRPLLNDKIIEFVKKNNKELFVYGNYNNNFKYDFPYYIVD